MESEQSRRPSAQGAEAREIRVRSGLKQLLGAGGLAVTIAAALLASREPVQAQGGVRPGDASAGRSLALRLCVNCHAVAPDVPETGGRSAPSFMAIAATSGQTPERLAARMIIPHPDMPAVALTISEMRDLIAYIGSLKPRS